MELQHRLLHHNLHGRCAGQRRSADRLICKHIAIMPPGLCSGGFLRRSELLPQIQRFCNYFNGSADIFQFGSFLVCCLSLPRFARVCSFSFVRFSGHNTKLFIENSVILRKNDGSDIRVRHLFRQRDVRFIAFGFYFCFLNILRTDRVGAAARLASRRWGGARSPRIVCSAKA